MRLDHEHRYNGQKNCSTYRMRLRDALEQGCNGYRAGRARLVALTFPPNPLPLPRCGRGRGGLCPTPSPGPFPFPPRERKRGGERSRSDPAPASFNDTESTNQFTPLPQCGRGAGGEGRPQRRSGAGGEGRPQRRSGVGGEGHPLGRGNVRRMTEQNVGPPTQCLLGHGTFPSSSRPLHIGHVPICTPILKDHGNGLKMMHAALYHPSLPGAVIVGFHPAPQSPLRWRCLLFTRGLPTVLSTAVEIVRQRTTDRRGYRPVQTIPLLHPPLNEAPAPVKND